MTTFWSKYETLIIIFGATGIGLVVWLVMLLLLWIILQSFGILSDYWSIVAALSTAVEAAVFLGVGFIAYRELAEVAESRYIEVAERLFDELNSPESVEARRWIFQNLPEDPKEGLENISLEGQNAIKRVLNSLDRVAFLTQAGWIPDEMIMPWMNPMIVKSWAKLEKYVDYEGQRRNEPDYYEHARALAERCVDWRAKNLPDAEITWVKKGL
jgi:hypothetical protein